MPHQDTLQPLSMQALPAAAESLSILQLGGSADGQEAVGGNPLGTLFLNVGLQVCRQCCSHLIAHQGNNLCSGTLIVIISVVVLIVSPYLYGDCCQESSLCWQSCPTLGTC